MKRFISLLLAIMLCVAVLPVPVGAAAGSEAIDITTGWYWPLPASNKYITSGFGAKRSSSLHQGLDIAAAKGTPIYAARSGVVYLAGWHKSMGNYVCIRHGSSNGKYIFTTYMHMTKRSNAAYRGVTVDQNTVIGYVGSTGDSTGNHLHFHIFKSSFKPSGASPSHRNRSQLNQNYINPSGIAYSYTRGSSTTGTETPSASTLNINMTSYPGTLKRGSSYGLRGSISSNYSIQLVSGSITSAGGQTVLTSTDRPYAKSLNVKNSNLNRRLTFNTLAAGTYSLNVVVTDASGKTISWSKPFSVYASNLTINMTKTPTSIRYRNSFGLRGNISSNEKITQVIGSVINSSGETVLSSYDWPNAKSMDVRTANLNNKIAFNRLARGNYTLMVRATDANGNTVTWSKGFQVY